MSRTAFTLKPYRCARVLLVHSTERLRFSLALAWKIARASALVFCSFSNSEFVLVDCALFRTERFRSFQLLRGTKAVQVRRELWFSFSFSLSNLL